MEEVFDPVRTVNSSCNPVCHPTRPMAFWLIELCIGPR